jgi:hypothetical protein
MSLAGRSLISLLILVASISIASGLDKENSKFSPPAIEQVSSKQTGGGITIAAVPYTTDAQASAAFGKVNPYEHGVLPVLVIVRNDGSAAVRLNDMRVEYIERDRSRIAATPASEVAYVKSPERPSFNPGPIPGIRRKKKNPLAAEEIEVRSFAAKMLPPGESAYGFFYFQTGHRPGASLYITGIQEAATGKDFLFFDIPLE